MKFGIEFKTLSGKKLSYVVQDKLLIGRSSACNVVLQEEGISRRHCLIEHEDGDFYLTDLESANGVIVDDHRIPKGQRVRFFLTSKLFLGPIEVVALEAYDNDGPVEVNETSSTFEKISPTSPLPSRRKDSLRSPKESRKVKDKLHPSMKAMLILIMIGCIYGGYLFMSDNAPIDIDRILFESSLKNKNLDGTVKTMNF